MNRDECRLSCVLWMASSMDGTQLTVKLVPTVLILTFNRVMQVWNISGDNHVFWVVLCFYSLSVYRCMDRTSNQATTASLHILFEYLLFIDRIIRRDIIWATRRAI
jgi:hypothetical protein